MLRTKVQNVREIENSFLANSAKLYHTGLPQLNRPTICDTLEKRDHQVFEDMFHTVAEKTRMTAGKTKKLFKSPLRIIDTTIISLCLAACDWAAYRKAKGAVKLHFNLDGDSLMPYNACLTTGKVHDVQGMAALYDKSGVIYVFDCGYVDYKSLYCIDLQRSVFVTRIKSNGA
jgi:hypothetical protein